MLLTYLSRGCVVICCHLLAPSTSLHTHTPPPHLVSNTLTNTPPTHSLFTHHNSYPFLHMPSAHFPYHYTFTSTFTIILSTTYINPPTHTSYSYPHTAYGHILSTFYYSYTYNFITYTIFITSYLINIFTASLLSSSLLPAWLANDVPMLLGATNDNKR